MDKLCCVRIGSARYSVPRELVGRDVTVIAAEGEVVIGHDGVEVAHHRPVAPGEVSLIDEHYGGLGMTWQGSHAAGGRHRTKF